MAESDKQNCGRCHTCRGKLRMYLDGEEWCAVCGAYRRYWSHGWVAEAAENQELECPPVLGLGAIGGAECVD